MTSPRRTPQERAALPLLSLRERLVSARDAETLKLGNLDAQIATIDGQIKALLPLWTSEVPNAD